MGDCHGNGEEHCCHLEGQVCRFLEEHTVPGRRWACGLRRELGSWDRVHADPRYVEHVQPDVRRLVGVDCGDWPRPDEQCATCGAVG